MCWRVTFTSPHDLPRAYSRPPCTKLACGGGVACVCHGGVTHGDGADNGDGGSSGSSGIQ